MVARYSGDTVYGGHGIRGLVFGGWYSGSGIRFFYCIYIIYIRVFLLHMLALEQRVGERGKYISN